MSMREVNHGGIYKKPELDNDLLVFTASTSDYNTALTPAEHGGIIPEQTNFHGIEANKTSPWRDGQPGKFYPATPSGLIVDHGGPIKPQGVIVNDTQ